MCGFLPNAKRLPEIALLDNRYVYVSLKGGLENEENIST